jgi:hypothetical protein
MKEFESGSEVGFRGDRITDFRWFLVISTFILALGSLPTWVGFASQTSEVRFRGLYFDSHDYAVHLSTMQAGQLGEWAYQMRFTTEPHQPAYIKMFYIFLGHASKFVGLNNETMYHVARWFAGYLALLSIYYLCNLVFSERSRARYAFLMVGMGSGLGWLLMILGVALKPISPIDFWLIDLYVFFSLSVFPHFSFLIAMMAFSVGLYFKYLHLGTSPSNESITKGSPISKEIAWIGLLSFAAGFINPTAFAGVDAAILGATVFYWLSIRKVVWYQFFAMVILASVQTLPILYNYFTLSRDPIWEQFMLQNQTPTPPFMYLLWGLAPFIPFALLGGWQAVRSRSPAFGSLLAWSISGIALAYLPLSIQRRFLLGLTIPLGILAVYGFYTTIKFHKVNLVLFGYVLVAAISSICLSLGSSLYMNSHPPDYFYPSSLDKAFEWFNRNAVPNDIAIASSTTGLLVAQKTPLKVFLGHEIETVNFGEKEEWVKQYYRDNLVTDLPSGVYFRYLIYGPYEREFAPDFVPDKNLKLVFADQELQIYEFLEK